MISEKNKMARRLSAPIFILAVAIRLLLIIAAMAKAGISFKEYCLLHDGWEYMRLCLAFSGGGLSRIGGETLRLYPGYPILMMLMGGFRFPEIAGIAISVISAGASCLLIRELDERKSLPFFMALVHPTWLIFSATVMSEGLSVALTLWALALLMRKKWRWAALAAGASAVVRPVGIFLVAIVAYCHYRENRGRGLWKILLAGLCLPGAYMISYWLMFGEMMQSVRSYSDKDFAYPVVSIARNMLSPETASVLKFFVILSVAFGLAGTAGLYERFRRGEGHLLPLFLWNATVFLFYLFLPSSWTFRCLDRFYLSLYPTSLVGLAPWFPRNKGVMNAALILFSVISFFIALRWLVNLSAVYPFEERAIPAFLNR
jgi:hypothetical protein